MVRGVSVGRRDATFKRVAGEDHFPDTPGAPGTGLGTVAAQQAQNRLSKLHRKISWKEEGVVPNGRQGDRPRPDRRRTGTTTVMKPAGFRTDRKWFSVTQRIQLRAAVLSVIRPAWRARSWRIRPASGSDGRSVGESGPRDFRRRCVSAREDTRSSLPDAER